jgi:hypothetical protein
MGERMEELCHNADGAAAVTLVGEMRAEFEVFRAILDERLAEVTSRHQAGR